MLPCSTGSAWSVKRRWFPWCAVMVALFSALLPARVMAEKLDFSRDVKPILAEHCIRCHGPDKAEGGLNLTDPQIALGELDSGAHAIVPGQPNSSELIARIASADESLRMPPEGKPLQPAEIERLQRWITDGAEFNQHWSFRPLEKPQPPAVKNTKWVRNPIDAFVLARLEAKNIEPSPEADRYTLAKRLYFDLLGLLPPIEEVDAFVADKSPDAYEKLVDRLLASPHFGERWGRHWLDAARYADSDGYEKDRARPDAYVFRDWVIAALNRDMPFDQFTVEQVAGDLLPKAGAAQKIATAFNRQTLTNEEGGVDQEEYRVAAVFDRTETLGSVWLGLTVGCARCHTHKYDPITHTEYYQLFAFFNDADETTEDLPVDATDSAALEARLEPLQAALAARRRAIAPEEQKWETAERARIESQPKTALQPEPLRIVEVGSSGDTQFAPRADGTIFATGEGTPAGETYTILAVSDVADITGFRIDALADAELPAKGPGRVKHGNFVLNALRVDIVDARGNVIQPVALQRAKADYEQSGYKAADVLSAKPEPKRGWAVGGKLGANHYLDVRTTAPLAVPPGARLRFTLAQNYGNQHTIGRFRVRALTGDARALHLPDEIVRFLEMYPEKRVAATKQTLFDYYADKDSEVQRLKAGIAGVYREFKAQLTPVRIVGSSLKPRDTHRFDRGDFLSPAEEVRPGTLGFLPALKQDGGGPTRLELARWLIADENPLTPRVAANQVWSHLFGAGIVPTINDFGVRGQPPTHPELLDWLAATYQRDLRWSTKRLIRLIVNSAAYRQASHHRPDLVQADPHNTLLYRQNRLRVEGELVRDLALGAGGILSAKVGGPSVFPPMPPDLAKLSYANNFSWTESKGEDRYRRGMYTFFKRTIPHPTLMTFDCPDANVACVDRSVSNTPLQALTLLNNVSFVEAAQALASRLLKQTGLDDDQQRLQLAVRICLARPAQADELHKLADLLSRARDYYREAPEAAEALCGTYAQASIPNHELAAWTATVRVLMNLDEFITRD